MAIKTLDLHPEPDPDPDPRCGILIKLVPVPIHNTGTYSNQDIFSNLSVLVTLKKILRSYFYSSFLYSPDAEIYFMFHMEDYFGHVCIVHSGAVRFINSLVFFPQKIEVCTVDQIRYHILCSRAQQQCTFTKLNIEVSAFSGSTTVHSVAIYCDVVRYFEFMMIYFLQFPDPWHFGVDPDPDPRIHASD